MTTDSEVGRRTSLSEWIRCAILEASWIVADLERTDRFTQRGTEQGQTFLPSLAMSSLICCHFLRYSPRERLNPHQRHDALFNALFPSALCQITWDCLCHAPVFIVFLWGTSGSVGLFGALGRIRRDQLLKVKKTYFIYV